MTTYAGAQLQRLLNAKTHLLDNGFRRVGIL